MNAVFLNTIILMRVEKKKIHCTLNAHYMFYYSLHNERG